MNLFDIVGPIMVGPSSSHTAGASKIGNIALSLLGEPVKRAKIYFHGSFLETGKGHGTDRALLAGLLGLACDDDRIPYSFDVAKKAGLEFEFGAIDLGDGAHPNSVKLILEGINGKQLELIAASIGAGRVLVKQIDGLACSFTGDRPTLIVQNDDTPGQVAKITKILADYNINIATMQLSRKQRGGHAVTVIETDQPVDKKARETLASSKGILKVTYLCIKEKEI